jgi:hypothetical protein
MENRSKTSRTKKPLWKPNWASMPDDTVGACFNSDGIAWAWSEKPEIRGSDKRPNDLKWRGPTYASGYTLNGSVVTPNYARSFWKDSWIDKP